MKGDEASDVRIVQQDGQQSFIPKDVVGSGGDSLSARCLYSLGQPIPPGKSASEHFIILDGFWAEPAAQEAGVILWQSY